MSTRSGSIDGEANGAPAAKGRGTRQKGWYMPWLFVGFFLIVFAVNGVMVYFAMSTYNGLETEDHFIKGIRYNAALEGARAQEHRGWKVGLEFLSPAPRAGRVTLVLRDRDGNLLTDPRINLRAFRPVAEGHDFDIELSYLGDGRYGGEAEFPLSGVWDLKLAVDHATGDYQETKRIWVK